MILVLATSMAMSSFQGVMVTRVIDGDTFVVNLPQERSVFGVDLPVRIKGIDTPELSDKRACMRKKALASKEALARLFIHAEVDLNFCERDKYFRILCSARVDKRYDAAEYLLKNGFAVLYDGGTKVTWKCR